MRSSSSPPSPALALSGLDEPRRTELVRDQLPRIERVLVRLLGPRRDLEDLVQNVCLELCRALPRFRGECSVNTFVAAITVRVARRAMRQPAFARYRAPFEDHESDRHDPETGHVNGQRMRSLRRALTGIAPKKRIAFCLWALEGLEVQEIAEVTNASVSATRSRIFYAQKELRALAAKDPVLREALGENRP